MKAPSKDGAFLFKIKVLFCVRYHDAMLHFPECTFTGKGGLFCQTVKLSHVANVTAQLYYIGGDAVECFCIGRKINILLVFTPAKVHAL